MYPNRVATSFIAAALVLFFAGSITACSRPSNDVTGAAQNAGDYNIAVMIGPARTFVSTAQAKQSKNAGKMVNGGGAPPVREDSASKPNHHLAVFIKKNNKLVRNAKVRIGYKLDGASGMQKLPVTNMWLAGKKQSTFHYGNNVRLQSGTYKIQVTVNANTAASLKIKVK